MKLLRPATGTPPDFHNLTPRYSAICRHGSVDGKTGAGGRPRLFANIWYWDSKEIQPH